MTIKQSIFYFLAAFAFGGFITLMMSGCVMISKDIYLVDSNGNEIRYTTQSKTDADVKDLIDAELKLPLP